MPIPSTACLGLVSSLALSGLLHAQGKDPDRDRDGLSDFQEVHKYRTNPAKADSDGDGTPDGDWNERREFTYTVRSVIQVMPAYDLATLNDDYQDARVLYECPEYVELEVIHYPLNTNADAIEGKKGWRKVDRKLAAYTKAGITTNYDRAMQKDLQARLAKAGIKPAELTDREVVERVSKWALDHAKSLNQTCVWAVAFDGKKPMVPDSLREKFDGRRGSMSDDDLFDREIYGAGMYEHQTRGTCTTSAHYLNTVLRAVGIPTRCIVTIPVVDPSDDRNVAMVTDRLTHHGVRRQIEKGVGKIRGSFAAHTYNEVWIGGRWRRLNYSRLGQNILDAGFMGLMTRVHTFSDLATANLGGGWGVGRQRPSKVFVHNNPYTALTLSDQFGKHAQIDNPAVDGEHHALTITKVYWFDSAADRPAMIGASWHGARDSNHGHLLVHVREDNGEGAPQYETFFDRSKHDLTLTANGAPTLRAQIQRSWWASGHGTEFHARIPAEELRKMKAGARYRLTVGEQHKDWAWRVVGDVGVLGR